MYTLYHGSGTCSLAIKAALSLTGLEFKTVELSMADGDHLKEEYKKINPLHKVPALTWNEGSESVVLTESAAILFYLSSKNPSAKLMPDVNSIDYPEALKWLQFLYSTLHPHWARLIFPERYGNDIDSIRNSAERELHKLYFIIETQLSGHAFVAGNNLSLADLYLMVSLHWEKALKKPLSNTYPAIDRYRQQIYNHKTIGNIYRTEFAIGED
jgi:glutathione S-transferase